MLALGVPERCGSELVTAPTPELLICTPKAHHISLMLAYGDEAKCGPGRCRLYKNFKEFEQIKPGFAIEEIHGGALLGVRSQDFVCFYDWNTGQVCSPTAHSTSTPAPGNL